ncbi:hypothetical protein AAMO2058_001433600 [Amorphochlora amoebiformis]
MAVSGCLAALCKAMCCFTGSYDPVGIGMEKMQFSKPLPPQIDVASKLRACTPSSWASMMRRFHILIMSMRDVRDLVIKHRLQWKTQLLEFLVNEATKLLREHNGENGSSSDGSPNVTVAVISMEFLRQTVTTLAEIDFRVLINTSTNHDDQHLSYSHKFIEKASVAGRISTARIARQKTRLLALILEKLNAYFTKLARRKSIDEETDGYRGDNEASTTRVRMGIDPGGRSATHTRKNSNVEMMSISEIGSVNELTEQIEVSVSRPTGQSEVVLTPNQVAGIGGMDGVGSPAFLLEVHRGRFSCEPIVDLTSKILNAKAINGIISGEVKLGHSNSESKGKKVITQEDIRKIVRKIANQQEVYKWMSKLTKEVQRSGVNSHRAKRRSRTSMAKKAGDPESDLHNTLDALSSALCEVLSLPQPLILGALQTSLAALDSETSDITPQAKRKPVIELGERFSAGSEDTKKPVVVSVTVGDPKVVASDGKSSPMHPNPMLSSMSTPIRDNKSPKAKSPQRSPISNKRHTHSSVHSSFSDASVELADDDDEPPGTTSPGQARRARIPELGGSEFGLDEDMPSPTFEEGNTFGVGFRMSGEPTKRHKRSESGFLVSRFHKSKESEHKISGISTPKSIPDQTIPEPQDTHSPKGTPEMKYPREGSDSRRTPTSGLRGGDARRQRALGRKMRSVIVDESQRKESKDDSASALVVASAKTENSKEADEARGAPASREWVV